jgi:pyridoxamine 5'-phosphate oxidase
MDIEAINKKIRLIERIHVDFSLNEKNIPHDPFELFLVWFNQVLHSRLYDPTAMVLATVTEDGLPDTRMVLLKELQRDQFIFYTNYESKKALELAKHPVAAINFYWPNMIRQVRIRGSVEKLSIDKNENYFKTRPRNAQLSATASHQSKMIPSRESLEKEIKKLEEHFSHHEVPCPAYWGGYAVKAFEYEFFQGREWRTHDRMLFTLEDEKWKLTRLSP